MDGTWCLCTGQLEVARPGPNFFIVRSRNHLSPATPREAGHSVERFLPFLLTVRSSRVLQSILHSFSCWFFIRVSLFFYAS